MADVNGVQIPDKIVVRLQKLLKTANYATKGDGSITEAEVNNAMARAQKLMAEWNVEASAIEATQDPTLPPEEKRVKETHDKLAVYEYQKRLWKAVSECNFCLHLTTPVYKEYQTPDPDRLSRGWLAEECDKVWVNRKVGFKHYIIGRESNVIITRMMGEYLEGALNSMCPYKTERKKAHSWKEGCSERLRTRLMDRKHELMKQSSLPADGGSGSTALAVQDVYRSEHERNIDAEWGDGTCDRWKADRAAREEEQERQEERRQMILDHPHVFTRDEYNDAVAHASRLHREAEREAGKRHRATDNYWDGKDVGAWLEGRKAADKIGLDPQMGGNSQKALEG